MTDDLADTAAPPDTVVCVFYDPTKSLVVEREMKLSTGLASNMVMLRAACEATARALGYPMFAIPSERERWLVFKMEKTLARYLRDWPSYAAAAMWMQHHG